MKKFAFGIVGVAALALTLGGCSKECCGECKDKEAAMVSETSGVTPASATTTGNCAEKASCAEKKAGCTQTCPMAKQQN